MSCRSRAIRSRSSRTASRARSAWASATSRASASCSPNPAMLGRSSCGASPAGQYTASALTQRSPLRSGSARAHVPSSSSRSTGQTPASSSASAVGSSSVSPNRAEPVAPGALLDPRQHRGQGLVPGQAAGEPRRRRGGRLQPQLVLAGLVVGAGVTDRHAGCGRQRYRDLLVARGEVDGRARRADLVGEVQVAEHRSAGPHRHPEERLHRRVVRREAHRRRMVGDVVQPQHVRGGREVTEHPAALGQVTDQQRRLRVDALVDELLQTAVLPEHPQGPVPGARQAAPGRDEPLQDGGHVEVGGHRDDRVHHRLEAVVAFGAGVDAVALHGRSIGRLSVHQGLSALGAGRRRANPGGDARPRHKEVGTMRALVVYESSFGNTGQVATGGLGGHVPASAGRRPARGLGRSAPAAAGAGAAGRRCADAGLRHEPAETREDALRTAGTEPTGPTIGVREWLRELEPPERPVHAATFDTRIHTPHVPGSAAVGAWRVLRRDGFEVSAEAESFWVLGIRGPLRDGELDRRTVLGRQPGQPAAGPAPRGSRAECRSTRGAGGSAR